MAKRLTDNINSLYFFLCCATVYIQAHYLVDVFGGLVTAVLFYALTNGAYSRWRTAKNEAIVQK